MKNAPSATPATVAPPGAPGAQAFGSRSAKDGIGTAYHTSCRLWFTLCQGVISEIYCPTVDTPNTRELEVYDAALKRDLPGGPCWRRYPFDAYGQKSNGSAYDGTGQGRSCFASATVHWTTDHWTNIGKSDT